MKCPNCGSEMEHRPFETEADCCGETAVNSCGWECKSCGYKEEHAARDCDIED